MKKIYTLIFASAFTLFSIHVSAATINVSVGGTGNVFTPNNFAANIGDIVLWTWAGGIHNVTSASVPTGAATFTSPDQSTGTFSYTITTAGNYGYSCTFHALSGMVGGFTVSSVGVLEPTVDLLTSAYPNPFKEKVTIKYHGIESIELFNVIGEKVKTFKLSATQEKMEIELSDLNAGIYFYRTYKEGVIVETKKIVKSK